MWTKILDCFRKKTIPAVPRKVTGYSVPAKREFYIQPLLPLDFSVPGKNPR